MLKRARVRFRVEPIPSAESIAAAQDEQLLAELTAEPAVVGDAPAPSLGDRTLRLAARLVASGAAERALALLLERVSTETQCAPRSVTPLTASHGAFPRRHLPPAPAGARHGRAMPPARTQEAGEGWTRFRVSWGQAQGADVRRLLPMLCRRGNIHGKDIGSIQLAPSFSFVDVATRVAADFERATRRPDPRDPDVTVRRA
jgi:ATP-dependent RNA helicase DeaD